METRLKTTQPVKFVGVTYRQYDAHSVDILEGQPLRSSKSNIR
jgi:hypothetical protein